MVLISEQYVKMIQEMYADGRRRDDVDMPESLSHDQAVEIYNLLDKSIEEVLRKEGIPMKDESNSE